MKEILYLIWSEEHGAWWRANKWGYTRNIMAAGRYQEKEATVICFEANKYLPGGELHEIKVIAPEYGHKISVALGALSEAKSW